MCCTVFCLSELCDKFVIGDSLDLLHFCLQASGLKETYYGFDDVEGGEFCFDSAEFSTFSSQSSSSGVHSSTGAATMADAVSDEVFTFFFVYHIWSNTGTLPNSSTPNRSKTPKYIVMCKNYW